MYKYQFFLFEYILQIGFNKDYDIALAKKMNVREMYIKYWEGERK